MQIWGFPKILGTFSLGPYNKDYSSLGSILGPPYFGKLPDNVLEGGIKGQMQEHEELLGPVLCLM